MTKQEAKEYFGKQVRSKVRLVKHSLDSNEHRVLGVRVWKKEHNPVKGLLIGTRTYSNGEFFFQWANEEPDYKIFKRTESVEIVLLSLLGGQSRSRCHLKIVSW